MTHLFKRFALAAVFTMALGSTVWATDNAHFYRPPSLYGTSPLCWFDRTKSCHKECSDPESWLTKFDVTGSAGQTKKTWDKNGKEANVLNPVGPTNLLYIGENVPDQPGIQNFADFIANYPGVLAGQGLETFGQVQFSGKFSTWQVDLAWHQNLCWGLFFELALPVRNVKFDGVNYVDLSPETGNAGFNQQFFAWKQFKNNLDTLLGNYGLAPLTSNWSKTGVGDLSLLLGWEKVFTVGEDFDIGFTLKGGVIIPTGDEQDTGHVFTVPLGYNEHVGLNGYAQFQFGLWGCVNMRVHGGATYFFEDNDKTVRLKTSDKQDGYLMLARGKATEEDSVLWHVGTDINFDHIAGGLSARLGYSYTHQTKTDLRPKDTTLYPQAINNDDPMRRAWHVHTVHFMADYDFSVHMGDSAWAPRVSGFYNVPFDGKNAFKMGMYGGSLGFDIRWCM